MDDVSRRVRPYAVLAHGVARGGSSIPRVADMTAGGMAGGLVVLVARRLVPRPGSVRESPLARAAREPSCCRVFFGRQQPTAAVVPLTIQVTRDL